MPRADHPAVLFALPQGLGVSGVNTWALRLSGALANEGWTAALLVHAPHAPHDPHAPPTHHTPHPPRPALRAVSPAVRVFTLEGVPPMETCGGDLSPYLPVYTNAIDRLNQETGAPVVFSPNLSGDSYAIAAAIAVAHPEKIRTVGWQHSDIPYDTAVLARYEPIIHRFVAVSRAVQTRLTEAVPARARDVARVPYGVAVPGGAPARAPLAGRPIRLIYTGRMEHNQKRVSALCALAEELARRGVPHELTLLGDGPAQGEVDSRLAPLAHARRLPPVPAAEIAARLGAADVFLLASRYEGLSVSMLEALALGCAPVVTRVASGAAEAIEDGVNGVLIPAEDDDTDETLAARFADAIESLVRDPARLAAMSRAAWATAKERYGVGLHARRAAALFDEIVAAPGRRWPASLPCAFTAPSTTVTTAGTAATTGTVPPDAARRVRDALEGIARNDQEARVALYGAGAHTRAVAGTLADSPAKIVCLLDDDAALHGKRVWGWPVMDPKDARKRGVTDVVISSHLHETDIHARRRNLFAALGVRVHALYTTPAPFKEVEAKPASIVVPARG